MSQFEALQVPASRGFSISPHNTNSLEHETRAIYVGGTGDIVLVTSGGDTITYKAVPVGTTLAVRAVIVKATNTTATLMLGLY